ncbi:MAG: hypothetical protein A2128_01695 [Candidatus Liptonbacteria bacterium GWC1_60_9]|uniref:Core domain-containing protein n=3 Tax=Candidatus Liptoniibacteriota TaxID=1817909 RepID=A0A1G2CNC8_9BACT|nr:MAG: hypothetical protein A2128_01695 [Candidatus Liptonbacteria bacterium GWC1_60_9]OGY99159.1 MAG: hypothetical protein A3E09_00945 [Candidatus Liptonbacteria bacterium RIFCSPHIGHO2_12_FULL_60_13]OGZ02141.1 MAG: hypothetical protein A3G64_00415 [Candidatus Liptonbacteria bacterium RIFCSPLOWO2_12_FULL_60_15]
MVKITETAAARVREHMAAAARGKRKDHETFYLRVGVAGGGCSGFTYTLEISDEPVGEHDRIFAAYGVRVIVDAKSYLYLNGSEIDYKTEGLQSGFVIVNPNAKSSCGCGQSHSF